LALRAEHPSWGGRKLHHWLVARGMRDVPAPSTITAILRRHGLLTPEPAPRDFLRFEHPTPNAMWQMDFMGHRPLAIGRVPPLTLLADPSRFALLVAACATEQHATVKEHLTAVFRHYGLPRAILRAILTDNGSPWASAGMGGITALEAWLLRSSPTAPSPTGKTLKATSMPSAPATNLERPHEALSDAVPVSRYRQSERPFPEVLPPLTYGPDAVVRTVTQHGSISWRGRRRFISRGLVGESVAIRPTLQEEVWTVYYCQRQLATIDLFDPDEV
jgi:transposase InsO family protein